MPQKIRTSSVYLLFIVGAYAFSYTRVGLCLLLLHYAVEAVFHASRLLAYADKEHLSRPLFRLHDALFVLARLGSILLAVLTFWYGLAKVPADKQTIDLAEGGNQFSLSSQPTSSFLLSAGNFNTAALRLAALVSIGVLQMLLMMNFITFHLKKQRENASATSAANAAGGGRPKRTQQEKAKLRKEQKPKKEEAAGDGDENELPEVDQNTKKTLRQRK